MSQIIEINLIPMCIGFVVWSIGMSAWLFLQINHEYKRQKDWNDLVEFLGKQQ